MNKNEISQYGITWSFDRAAECGQFANGDWWVVGPVNITKITPQPSPLNGSMVNPIPGQPQGLYLNGESGKSGDSPRYDANKNITSFPFAPPLDSSIVSTSKNPHTWVAGADAEKTWFKEAAVLTVLSKTPAPGSFRPPYAGSDKSIRPEWNESKMNYSVLGNYVAPSPENVPNVNWLERATSRPLIEMNLNYLNSNWKASWAENKSEGYPRRTYGREISHISSGAGLWLQLNKTDSEKKKLLTNIVQWGIDVYGLLKAGMQWQPNGGHNHGRLLPLYIAAKVLGDKEMMSFCDAGKSSFQEFSQHWIVSAADVSTPRSNASIKPYTAVHIGMAEWNSGGPGERNQASSDWNATNYRFINGAPNCAVVATILLMKGRAEVKHEPLYKYILERYYPIARNAASHTLPSYGDNPTFFTRDMMDAYVVGGKPPEPPLPPDPPKKPDPIPLLKSGSAVETIRTTNVRAEPKLSAALKSSQSAGARATISGEPIVSDAIVWWTTTYEDGTRGWSGEDNFKLTIAPPPVKKRRIEVLQSLDGGLTYLPIGSVEYPKITKQKYKTRITTSST